MLFTLKIGVQKVKILWYDSAPGIVKIQTVGIVL